MPTHTAINATKVSDLYIKPVLGLAFSFYSGFRCWPCRDTIASFNDTVIRGAYRDTAGFLQAKENNHDDSCNLPKNR